MAIEKRFIHFKKFSDFNSKKLSANEANTQYTVGISGAIQTGSPDVLYQSYVWIKDTQQQWTHGQIYNGSDLNIDPSQYISKDDVDAELSETSTNPVQNQAVRTALEGMSYAFSQFLNEKQGTISDLETIRDGAAKGATSVQPSDLADVATSGSYNDLSDKPTIPSAVHESTVSGWGFTKNIGTVSQIKINGATITRQTNGLMDIGSYQVPLVSGTNIKTINNTSILGSGNIRIDANIQAVDTQETLDDVNTNTYVKYVAQTLTEVQKAQVRENIGIVDNNNNYVAWNSATFEMGYAYYMTPNKKYICTLPLTHLIFIEGTMDDTWHNNVTDLYNEYTVIFECNETQIETPNSWIWANGSVPTLENGVRYELSISLMYINNQYLTHAVLVPFKSV